MQSYTLRLAHGKKIPVRLSAKIDWQPDAPYNLLTIKQRGETDLYLLEELPNHDSDERVFQLYPAASDPVNNMAEAQACGYTVFIDRMDTMDDCTCPGRHYQHKCKHADALRGLISAGELPHPYDREANEANVSLSSAEVPF